MRSKKAIINIITSLFLQIILVICGLIVPRTIILNYGSDVNGLVSSITQFLAYITLLEAGVAPVVKSILYKPIAQKNKLEIEKILKAAEKFFRTISYIFIVYILVLSFIYPQIVSGQFATGYTISLLLIMAISKFAEYYFGMVYRIYLQAEQKAYITSMIQIITTILNTVIIVILVKLNFSIQFVQLASAVVFVLRPIIQNLYVKKKYNINLKNVEDNYNIKNKWDGLAQHIASVINTNTDVIILTMFCNTVEVSVYTVYLLVMNGIKNLIQAFTGGIDAALGDMLAKGEKVILNNSFKIYELFYFTIITIVFTVTLLMILPFVKVYTIGITDANYYRPIFACLLVISQFAWAIRLPYSTLTLAAGHFKETKKGAWIEAGVNLVLSVILVIKFGLVGVVIGTLVAMIIRTIEFMYHTSKYILERSGLVNLKRIILLLIQVVLVIFIINNVFDLDTIYSYSSWVIYAIYITLITSTIIGISNILVYRKEAKGIFVILKNTLHKNA